jgi:glycosyltransferase involved in cell wall biosynthesis
MTSWIKYFLARTYAGQRPSKTAASVGLDVTPAVVNRTAIHHIVLDSITALSSGFDVTLSLCGTPVPPSALTGPQPKLLKSLQSCVEDPSVLRKHVKHRSRTAAVMLYFDPLYVLFVDRLLSRDIVLVLDMTPITNPQWHHPNVARLYQRAFEKIVAEKPTLATISENTRKSMTDIFPLDPNEIATVPLYAMQSLDKVLPIPVPGLNDQKFLLFVGSLESRKNVSGLISAFLDSGISASGYHLAIVGGNGNGAEQIRARACGAANVHILGFVSANMLAWLYRNALWFVYPSYLEGFGVPILEAMQAGLPVVGSTTGAAPEVIGDAGLLFNPYDPDQVRTVIGSLPQVPEAERLQLAALGKTRAACFSVARYSEKLKSLVTAACAQ